MVDRGDLPLSKLQEITLVVLHAASADNIEQALQRIAHATRELVQAKYAALGIPDGEGGLTHFKVSGITPEEVRKIDHPPIGRGLLGAIMHERQPILTDHISEDPRSSGFPSGHPTMEKFLGVPVQIGEVLFGMLYMTDREDGKGFDATDQWLVETMARYAALAIAGVQLREKNHRLTLLEERQRIGMALHDGIIQSLYALGMHIDIIRTQVDAPPNTFTPVIDGLNNIIEEIRDYIMNLRSRQHEEWTLHTMLDEALRPLYIPPELEVVIQAPHRVAQLSPQDIESICMIIREGVSNIVRHADAKHIILSAWYYPDHIRFTITDDGVGFDKEDLKQKNGLGVQNMHERARIHHGVLEINSSVGQGTTITLDIPTQPKPLE
jgi:signal transduction histidine kinase